MSGSRAYVKHLRKTVRAFFPVFKEKGDHLKDVTEKLTLQFNHDLDIRLQNIGINITPAGTLETSASGVVAYNVGTSVDKLRWFRLGRRKFHVEGRFGNATSTLWAGGDIVQSAPYDHISADAITRILPRFLGESLQCVPPYDFPPGEPRKDVPTAVVPPKRPAICHSIAIKHLQLPNFSFELECGPGFSARMFVHDLGQGLGCCAHVTSLVQTQHGPFRIDDALPSYSWSWKEVSAISEKLFDVWFPYIGTVRNEMADKRELFQRRSKYQ